MSRPQVQDLSVSLFMGYLLSVILNYGSLGGLLEVRVWKNDWVWVQGWIFLFINFMDEDEMDRDTDLNVRTDSISLPLGTLNQINNYSVFYEKQANYDKEKIKADSLEIESVIKYNRISSNDIEKLLLDGLMNERKYKTSKKCELMRKLRQSYRIQILNN